MRQMQTFVIAAAFGAFGVIGAVAPGLARAQGGPEPASRLSIGGNIGLSPTGTIEVEAQGLSASEDTAFAVGVSGIIDYQLTPIVSIGFAPNLIFNAKAKDASDSATQVDLPVRLTVGGPVAPQVRLYGFVSPGYGIAISPDDGGDSQNASGFLIGFGGGAGIKVAPKITLTGELGYQFRFLSLSQQNVDIDLHLNYLTLSAGAMFAL